MSKSKTWETGVLELLFTNTDFTTIGDAGGLRGSAVAGNLNFSLHTANPGETGTQATNEIAYTSYARVAVARSAAGWTVTNDAVAVDADVTFPAGTGGSGTATHWGLGADSSGVASCSTKAPLLQTSFAGMV